MEKKTYVEPKLTEFGKIEDITAGPGRGFLDAILGAVGITIGDGAGGWLPPYDCHTGS